LCDVPTQHLLADVEHGQL